MAISENDQELLKSSLNTLGFLELIPAENLEELMNKFSKVTFEKNEIVLRQGRSGRAFYVLSKGVISVYTEDYDENKTFVNKIKPVSYFGEIAILDEAERIATLLAEDNVIVFVLGKKEFLDFFYSIPEIQNKINKIARKRKKETGSVQSA